MPFCDELVFRVGSIEQWIEKVFEYFMAWFEEDVTARFDEIVKLLRPETCAWIDVEDIAALVLLQSVSKIR
jgi:hypothetical protein